MYETCSFSVSYWYQSGTFHAKVSSENKRLICFVSKKFFIDENHCLKCQECQENLFPVNSISVKKRNIRCFWARKVVRSLECVNSFSSIKSFLAGFSNPWSLRNSPIRPASEGNCSSLGLMEMTEFSVLTAVFTCSLKIGGVPQLHSLSFIFLKRLLPHAGRNPVLSTAPLATHWIL